LPCTHRWLAVVETTSTVETVVEVVETVEIVVEVVETAKPEYPASKKARPPPAIPRVAVPGIPVPGTSVSIIAVITHRRVLHSIAKRVHALRVVDIVACLQIEFAGRRIVCTDRRTTDQARRTPDRRTGTSISGSGADCRPRCRSKHRADGSAANGRLSSRLPWLDIADRGRCMDATLLVVDHR
jgi:hypothetical protein